MITLDLFRTEKYIWNEQDFKVQSRRLHYRYARLEIEGLPVTRAESNCHV